MSQPLVVVADIGGTNTRVALCRGEEVQSDSIQRYRNAENDSIGAVLRDYLAKTGAAPQAVCVDMAGPVENGVGRLTNLDWVVDPKDLRAATGAGHVEVLNDMQAMGFSLGHLDASGLHTVIDKGPRLPDATRMVFNVGTGLNAAPVYHLNGQTLVPPGEAGHVSMIVKTPQMLRLRDWVAGRLGEEPGLEDVLSGRGLSHIHSFLAEEAGETVKATPAEIFDAFKAGDARATEAARLFTQIMGIYAGDLALCSLPEGGVYLVGGVAGHFAPHLMDLGFAEAFADKGRFGDFMARFPVHVVTDDYAALKGCAVCLAERMPH